jgi:predicted ribosomally synthesized peptide with SipW-like signal peptide
MHILTSPAFISVTIAAFTAISAFDFNPFTCT